MRRLPVLLLLFIFPDLFAQKEDFSFLFITDMHLRPDTVVEKAFDKAVKKVKEIRPDFILSGGDQVFDIMRGRQTRGDSLFSYYLQQTRRFGVPVYNCVGNHDLFGIYEESPEDSTHPDYKLGMYQRYLGKPYYSFDHKGWHFIVLNVLDVENYRYVGRVDAEQLEWLETDLQNVRPKRPWCLPCIFPW
ncbi:MAG: metallophosphoesterase [Leadbetterella sp.]|nr:metallophosphoesterase [Leadbetterella sp.]